jgi:hypothetical protein
VVYENQGKDLINFYVQKYVIGTFIRLNLLMKNDVDLYSFYLEKSCITRH